MASGDRCNLHAVVVNERKSSYGFASSQPKTTSRVTLIGSPAHGDDTQHSQRPRSSLLPHPQAEANCCNQAWLLKKGCVRSKVSGCEYRSEEEFLARVRTLGGYWERWPWSLTEEADEPFDVIGVA